MNLTNKDTADKIISAVYRKDYATLGQLLSLGNVDAADEDQRTPLMNAILAEDADLKMVKYLIDHGADVKLSDGEQHWTALHFAARDQHLDFVRLLLDAGADPNAVDCFGNTPLGRCLNARFPNFEIIKLLMSRGADPFQNNNFGSSPVEVARLTGNEELLSILIGNNWLEHFNLSPVPPENPIC